MPFNSLFKRRPLIIFCIAFISIIFLVVFIKLVGNYSKVNYLGEYHSESHFGVYRSYAVSTDSAQCANVGKQILDRNGTAGDAAISVLLCMGVTIPHSMGLGGGSLILYYNSTTKQSYAIDAREVAPKFSHKDLLLDIKGEKRLPLSIGVPGELAGYWQLHQRFGRLDWSQLFNGAISLSENGFYVSQHLDNALKLNEIYIRKYPPLREIFINQRTDTLYKQGDKITNKKLSQTLKILSQSLDPLNLFYRGFISQYIIEDIKQFTNEFNMSFIITSEDFEEYKPRTDLIPIRDHLKRGNLTLHTFPVPGSGNILSFIMKVMESYDDLYPKAGKSLKKSILFYHRLIETFKYAYSQRSLLQDINGDIDESINLWAHNLTSDEFIGNIIESIDDTKTYPIESGRYGSNIKITEDKGTAHVSVVDREGNAVSVSTTINSYFGSKILSKSTGILLNDELFDFKLNYEKYNYPSNQRNLLYPGKRPFSSMCPSIITDGSGKVRLVIGAAGGTKITTGVALVMIRNLWLGEDIKRSIDAYRLHHQFSPDVVIFDNDFPEQILNGLTKLGHNLSPLKGRGSVVTAISANKDKLFANSDYRKGGDVDGI